MATLTPELLSRINERLPDCRSILVVGSVAVRDVSSALTGPVPIEEVLGLEFHERFDLGLVFGPSQNDAAAVSRLRDLGCRRVLIMMAEEAWSTNELRALGFQPIGALDNQWQAFLYDSDLLNQPRDWNNPSNWANPENFGKYRW